MTSIIHVSGGTQTNGLLPRAFHRKPQSCEPLCRKHHKRTFTPCDDILGNREKPQKPRLVGVELNPGPTPFAAFKTALGALNVVDQAAKALVKGQPKTLTKGSKPQVGRKKKLSNLLQQRVRSIPRFSNPPVSLIPSFKQQMQGFTDTITLPFSGVSISLINPNATSLASFAPGFSDGATDMANGLDLQPQNSANYAAAFGFNLNEISKNFALFRLLKLKMEFIPVSPTSVGGMIAFAASQDPFDTKPASLNAIGTSGHNIVTPLWCPAELDLSFLCGSGNVNAQNWYQTDVDTGSEADMRMHSPGSIQAYVLASNPTVPASGLVGVLRFTGVIQFKSLTQKSALGASHASRHSALEEEKALESFEKVEDSNYSFSAHLSQPQVPLRSLPSVPETSVPRQLGLGPQR